MRPALLFTLCCSLIFFPQQSDIWQHVSANPGSTQLRTFVPSPKQLAIVRKALAARVQLDNWPCAEGDEPDWVEKVTFYELPVSTSEEVVLVEGGLGCARGGQGSNGAMWIMKFKAGKANFRATPEHKFNGWLYSIQPSTSRGFRDLVLGWHMSAMETDLAYFRFDGRSYQLVGNAQLLVDDADVAKIVPTPIS
jgi:hypothetical protein